MEKIILIIDWELYVWIHDPQTKLFHELHWNKIILKYIVVSTLHGARLSAKIFSTSGRTLCIKSLMNHVVIENFTFQLFVSAWKHCTASFPNKTWESICQLFHFILYKLHCLQIHIQYHQWISVNILFMEGYFARYILTQLYTFRFGDFSNYLMAVVPRRKSSAKVNRM